MSAIHQTVYCFLKGQNYVYKINSLEWPFKKNSLPFSRDISVLLITIKGFEASKPLKVVTSINDYAIGVDPS